MSAPLVIAVDGPAAAGKGTLARRLARHLGLPYLDTGLLYRATGRRVLDAGADPADPVAAEEAARALTAADLAQPELREQATATAASQVAAIPGVRAALLDFQRRFGGAHGAVLDGRDIGTVVFPEARVKLFVTAGAELRAARRHAELRARGVAATFAEVAAEMAERDARDSARGVAPLRPAEDALLLDTSALDAEAAFQAALTMVESALARAESASDERFSLDHPSDSADEASALVHRGRMRGRP